MAEILHLPFTCRFFEARVFFDALFYTLLVAFPASPFMLLRLSVSAAASFSSSSPPWTFTPLDADFFNAFLVLDAVFNDV